MWWSWPLELLQRAGVSVWVGGGWRGQLLGLQAVGEGVQVFHQETHHQHVLLCRTEGFLKRQPVTKCYTNTWQPISSWFQRTANHNAPQSKSSQTITRGSERFVFEWVQRSHTCQSFCSYSVKSAISMILVLKSCWSCSANTYCVNSDIYSDSPLSNKMIPSSVGRETHLCNPKLPLNWFLIIYNNNRFVSHPKWRL